MSSMAAAVDADESVILDAVQRIFPEHAVQVVWQDAFENTRSSLDMLIYIARHPCEFPCSLWISPALAKGCDEERWMSGFARMLSLTLDCRVIADGERYADSPAPCFWMVWDRSVAFLADDTDSLFIDDGIASVAIIRRIPEVALDYMVLEELRAVLGRARQDGLILQKEP